MDEISLRIMTRELCHQLYRSRETAEFKAKKIVENAQAQAEKTTEEAKHDAYDYLLTIQKSVESEQNKPVPKKKKEAAEEIVSLCTENAALRERLKFRTMTEWS